jgi:hypothetical protein
MEAHLAHPDDRETFAFPPHQRALVHIELSGKLRAANQSIKG